MYEMRTSNKCLFLPPAKIFVGFQFTEGCFGQEQARRPCVVQGLVPDAVLGGGGAYPMLLYGSVFQTGLGCTLSPDRGG